MKLKILNIVIIFIGFSIGLNSQTKNLNKDFVRMGALPKSVSGIDIKDANAAFKIWTDTFVKRLKAKGVYDFVFEYKLYDDISTLRKDINNGSINYFNVSTEDYFDLNTGNDFIPFLTGLSYSPEKYSHFLLITSSKNKFSDLKQLSNKRIIYSKSGINNFGIYWLKVLLRENLGSKAFNTISFQSINESENEDLFSVYFGKIDYALISEGAFVLACELNPSIKNNIRIVARSEKLINGLFVYRNGMNPNTISVIKDIATNIHNDNEGRQILNLFKIQRIIPITKDDLHECEIIMNKYNRFFN